MKCICFIYLEPKWPLFLKVNPPKTRPFPIKTGVIWVLDIYIYILYWHSIASRYIQHFDKATDGGQRLSWPSEILQVLRKKGQRRESVPVQSLLYCASELERWARAGVSPCATWHPGLFPTAQRHGLLLRTEVDTEKPLFVKGLDERRSRIQHCVMKTKAKEKTHTHTHPKVCQ